jgi:hypothetical protein
MLAGGDQIGDRRLRVHEGVLALAVSAALIAGEIWFTRSSPAITRPLWLDEIHTLLVADRGTLAESIRALAAGADTNPITVFLLYRLVGGLTGGLSEVSMRFIAIASVLLALPLVYLLLRDELGRFAAACAAVALWSQPVVVNAAFGARFYGPWLASAAGLLFVLRRAVQGPWTVRSAVALAALSAIVCTVHYFGVLSWAAGVAAALALGRANRRVVVRRLLPALAGPAALAACLPFYFGQRAALSVSTWVPQASLADHLFLLVVALVPLSFAVPLVSWGVSRFLRRRSALDGGPEATLGAGGWLLLSQVAVPIALVVVSLLVQPATQLRYWIPGSLAVATAVAFAVSRSVRSLQWLTLAAAFVASASAVRDEGAAAREFAETVSEDSAYAERAAAEQSFVVARRRHTLYPMLRAAPRAAQHALLFGGPSTGRDSMLVLNDLDLARVHARFYGFPRISSRAELRALPSFYFVELDSKRSPSPNEFPGRTISRVAPRLFLIR